MFHPHLQSELLIFPIWIQYGKTRDYNFFFPPQETMAQHCTTFLADLRDLLGTERSPPAILFARSRKDKGEWERNKLTLRTALEKGKCCLALLAV